MEMVILWDRDKNGSGGGSSVDANGNDAHPTGIPFPWTTLGLEMTNMAVTAFNCTSNFRDTLLIKSWCV